ncbi:MAG: sigma-70 family RNA polymerase sigma factor [Chloroflexota bacterium]|nr:MAG: sigma-70 family RNA polymerase sigma factor [Chloroflexota bacterium]
MGKGDYTDIGGVGESFLTTHWSLIGKVQARDNSNHDLSSLLLGKYWKPVYCYLRRKGYDNEQAKDLTQGFFQEVVLGRDLIQKADPSKGKFRTYLLFALKHYLINVHKVETAQKRMPKERLIPLDQINMTDLPPCVFESDPEDIFNYTWVSELLEQVLEKVQTQCRQREMTTHWQVFHERVVQPILNRRDPPSMKEICVKYSIKDTVRASNMITPVKTLFQKVLKEQVRDSVTCDEEVADELEHIKQFFPKKHRG